MWGIALVTELSLMLPHDPSNPQPASLQEASKRGHHRPPRAFWFLHGRPFPNARKQVQLGARVSRAPVLLELWSQ